MEQISILLTAERIDEVRMCTILFCRKVELSRGNAEIGLQNEAVALVNSIP
jgi:hypothetical protein